MGSMYWSELNTPWALENADKPFDWFVLVIDHIPQDVEASLNYTVLECINGSFSNSEWRFHQFTMFYQQFLKLVDWHTEVAHHCTYEQLRYPNKTGLNVDINGNLFILQEEIPFVNFVLYTNDELLDKLHEACQDFDIFEEEIIPFTISGKEFFVGMKKYFNDIPEIRCIQHLIIRVSMVYLFIYLRIVNMDYDADPDWFETLSPTLRDKLTKIANFDSTHATLADLEYNDIYNEYYVFYTFLIRACNYNGRLIDDYVEGVAVEK